MSMPEPDGRALRAAPAVSQFVTLAVVALVFLVLGIAWGGVDARLVDGAPVWMKPLKFALSFAVLFATIAVVEARLSPAVREGRALRVIGWVMAAAFLSEMAYMTYQAALAQPSHFNVATPFNRLMYEGVMAGGAVSLVVCIALIGWIAARDVAADLGPGLREGVTLGFVMTFGMTMITAGWLSVNGGHFVGLHPAGAATLPLFGWSGATGDLRPAHFAALHAMQVLPLLGLWADRRGIPNPVRAVRVAAGLYAALTFGVFVQALMGLPLIALG